MLARQLPQSPLLQASRQSEAAGSPSKPTTKAKRYAGRRQRRVIAAADWTRPGSALPSGLQRCKSFPSLGLGFILHPIGQTRRAVREQQLAGGAQAIHAAIFVACFFSAARLACCAA